MTAVGGDAAQMVGQLDGSVARMDLAHVAGMEAGRLVEKHLPRLSLPSSEVDDLAFHVVPLRSATPTSECDCSRDSPSASPLAWSFRALTSFCRKCGSRGGEACGHGVETEPGCGRVYTPSISISVAAPWRTGHAAHAGGGGGVLLRVLEVDGYAHCSRRIRIAPGFCFSLPPCG